MSKQMQNVMKFLEEMIENPSKEISNTSGDKSFILTQEQRSGFKLACILIQTMIEKNKTFVVTECDERE